MTAPRGTLHRFFNDTGEPSSFTVELTPGHRGFEQSIIIAYGLANDGLTGREYLGSCRTWRSWP